MKQILKITLLLLAPALVQAQAQQATLLGRWDDPAVIGSAAYNNRYNEVWSVAVNNHEYAVLGSTMGTHFIDVTDPENPFQADFVPGKAQGAGIIHRDYKTYKHYIYGVCDEGASSLQIMDVSTLPDSVRLVYNSDQIIVTTHNIFVDTARARLYAFVFGGGQAYGYGGMAVLSLANPEQPTYIRKFNNIQGFSFGHIHDGYVNRDTAFLDAGDAGMCVADFSIPSQPKLLGSLTNYPGKGYNHSGWRSEDGRYYFMADENHGSPVKTVDVQDFEDIQVVDSYNAASSPTQIPHNPLVACNYLYVAYYYDGLQVYDISDPLNVERVLYYDTSTEPDGPSYKGAWGVNPFLPSGNILIADMQNGLFVFKGVGDNCVAGTSSSSGEQQSEAAGLDVSPVPSSGYLKVSIGSDPAETQHGVITISDLKGTVMHTQTFESNEFDVQIPGILPPGCYILRAKTTAGTMVRKIIFSI